jgi:hypothetical protein
MKNKYPYFAIEVHGVNDNIFCIKKVVSDHGVDPVDYMAYRSREEAQARADEMGIKIEKIGGFYEIF